MDRLTTTVCLVFIFFLFFGFASMVTLQFESIIKDQKHCSNVDLRYRQLDGTCNHRLGYGSTNMPVKRYIRAHYHDGIGAPRMYSAGNRSRPLPSPRFISMRLNPDQPKKSKFTLLVMQMGQLIDHDITMAPITSETMEDVPKCCSVPKESRHPHCFIITIPESDSVFNKCMEFLRSDAATDKNGNTIYPREQINSLTAFLDASCIYGDNGDTALKLRTQKGKGALLKTRLIRGKERLPRNSDRECLKTSHPLSYCQMAGDSRVNEQPGLSSLHLVFHLQHNAIVQALATQRLMRSGLPTNPLEVKTFIKYTSNTMREKLYQEARKIMSAILQKITYCDWLPLVVGPRLVKKYGLDCRGVSPYFSDTDPRIANAFLTTAFRFGHSLIPNEILVNDKMKALRDMFDVPDASLFHFESIVDGLCQKNMSRSFDRFISKSVTESLFKTNNKSLDLVALNIQRGRDHGIPTYHRWRRFFRIGMRRISRSNIFGPGNTEKLLKSVFSDYRDIDLYSAGLMEAPMTGAIVGPTFGHIIANQFSDLKYGDAYFFTTSNKPQGFTASQREAIMKVNIAQMLCSASKMSTIQKNPFIEVSPSNPNVPCNTLPEFDATPWKNDI